jgi:DNA recombination protein RmuC
VAVLVLAVVVLVLVAVAAWAAGARRAGVDRPARSSGAGADPVADVARLGAELTRLGSLVQRLGETTAERFGAVDRSLHEHAAATRHLAGTAADLREALANPNVRGQWGERMVADVLRLAGLHEGVNYIARTGLTGEGRGIPDITFLLPQGHVLFMDVKFPMAAYLRYLAATTDHDRARERQLFLNDVRAHVRELARRDYAATDDRPAVDNVLMFVPNESLAGFIHESDPSLIDDALRSRVVLCSPLTLYAFLGVIRQAYDNFVVEQTSREILALLGTFSQQWVKYSEQIDKVRRGLDSVGKAFDDLAGTRRRALERPLAQIEQLRRNEGVAAVALPGLGLGPEGGGDDTVELALPAEVGGA